jgi:cyclic pyranopterin phosphate synthase
MLHSSILLSGDGQTILRDCGETFYPPDIGKVFDMLQDYFGREFRYLRLSVTDVCNFSCNYCLPEGYQGDSGRSGGGFLRLSEIRNIAAAFAQAGTRKIRITGGEPSVRSDLPDIIAAVKQTPGIEKVVITTNGYKLPQRIEHWVNAGLDGLNLSIDSLDPSVFQAITGHHRLQELLDGLDRAAELGMSAIKVNVVMMRGYNGQQIDQFLNWVKYKPLTLRFIELMQTGDNEDFYQRNHISGELIKERLLREGWEQALRSKDAGPAQEFYHADYQGRIGLIMPYSKDFCASCNRLRISATGKLHLCLFSDKGIELRHLLQRGDQKDELIAYLQAQLNDKKVSHYLRDGYTGGTRHLAMLGG